MQHIHFKCSVQHAVQAICNRGGSNNFEVSLIVRYTLHEYTAEFQRVSIITVIYSKTMFSVIVDNKTTLQKCMLVPTYLTRKESVPYEEVTPDVCNLSRLKR